MSTTARRLLNRIEMVFDYAKAHGWRTADNPATWARVPAHPSGAAGQPDPSAITRRSTGARRPPSWRACGPTWRADSMAALALELMILTACRSGEVRGMLWSEIDFDTATWTIPAERMKRNREHEVPLSADAMAIIKRLEPARIGKFVFPGRSNMRPIAHWAVWELVQRLTGREADRAHRSVAARLPRLVPLVVHGQENRQRRGRTLPRA